MQDELPEKGLNVHIMKKNKDDLIAKDKKYYLKSKLAILQGNNL